MVHQMLRLGGTAAATEEQLGSSPPMHRKMKTDDINGNAVSRLYYGISGAFSPERGLKKEHLNTSIRKSHQSTSLRSIIQD